MESKILLRILHKGRSVSINFKRDSKYDKLIDAGKFILHLNCELLSGPCFIAVETFGICGENQGGFKLIDEKGYLLTKDLFEHIISVTKKQELTFHLQGNANYIFINDTFFLRRIQENSERRKSEDPNRSRLNCSLHDIGSPMPRRSLGRPNVRI